MQTGNGIHIRALVVDIFLHFKGTDTYNREVFIPTDRYIIVFAIAAIFSRLPQRHQIAGFSAVVVGAFIGFWGTGCQILFGTPVYIEYLVLGSTSLSRCFLVTTDMPNTQDVVNSIAFNVARLGTEMACFRLMLNFDIFLTYLFSTNYISTKKHRENE